MVDSRSSARNVSPKTPVTDFIWSSEDEPHAARKKAMIAKYGREINKLMGPEPLTKYITAAVVVAQLCFGVLTRDWSWGWWLLMAYVVGGTLNHVLFLAIHEITHNLAFKTPVLNDLFAMFANLPIVVPYSMMFKSYHAEHHRYQGWDGVDTDIPTKVEALLFRNFFGKLIFCTTQIFFYALRPCMVRAPKLNIMHVVNWVFVVGVHAAYLQQFGWNSTLYLLVSDFMAGTLTPMAGHFIAEHYVFDPAGKQETYSYYGPWNNLAWNVGYHNEHHDFPNVPWSRLKQLRATAPEFYDSLIQTPSWPGTILRFICDPRVSAWSRVKREKYAYSRQGPLVSSRSGKGKKAAAVEDE